MKKRYLFILIILSFIVLKVQAMSFLDCNVIASYRLLSLDEDHYICDNNDYGTAEDSIYYSKEKNTIILNKSNIYYLTNYDKNVNIEVVGDNTITMLHLSTPINIIGSGTLKFKEDSYIKKVNNGEKVYQFEYNGKMVVDENKKIYEGTLVEFAENYLVLQKNNELPESFNEEDYNLLQVVDFINMVPVAVTPSWIATYIVTDNETSVVDGYALIKEKVVKEEVKEEKKEEKKEEPAPKEENNTESTTLTNQNVTFISEKKLDKKYKLKVNELPEESKKVEETIEEGKMISLYDISIYKGKKQVDVKTGKYKIKIKLRKEDPVYDNYQIVYVSDDGKISEYLEGTVEDGYVVFETTHLSKYGIIGKNNPVPEVKEEVKVEVPKKDSKALPITILVSFAVLSTSLILFVVYKSKHLKKKS